MKVKCLAPILLLALLGTPAVADPVDPDDVRGLEAWFKTEPLHRKLNANENLKSWPDSSGNDHDLTLDGRSAQPIFMILRINRKPVVHFVKGAKMAMNQPFELDDHTIFVVYLTRFPERAFFTHQGDDTHGILLQDSRNRIVYQLSNEESELAPYSVPGTAADDYRIAVLAREDGVLKSWINGKDVSTNSGTNKTLVVGKFFSMTFGKRGRRDANGLRIAEMMFYDRYLTVAERNGVTEYLSDKFDLPVEMEEAPLEIPVLRPADTALAWLASDTEMHVNVPAGARIIWDRQVKLTAPLRHEVKGAENSRIYSSRDGTAVELRVMLPLFSETPDTNIRLLLLKNGDEYLDDEAESGPFGGVGKVGSSLVELTATVELAAGEYVEVIAFGVGAAGTAIIGLDATIVAEPVTE